MVRTASAVVELRQSVAWRRPRSSWSRHQMLDLEPVASRGPGRKRGSDGPTPSRPELVGGLGRRQPVQGLCGVMGGLQRRSAAAWLDAGARRREIRRRAWSASRNSPSRRCSQPAPQVAVLRARGSGHPLGSRERLVTLARLAGSDSLGGTDLASRSRLGKGMPRCACAGARGSVERLSAM